MEVYYASDVSRYINKGLEKGLTKDDYFVIKRIVMQNNESDKNIVLKNLIELLFKKGVIHKYSFETIKYLKDNCMLLPLVLANNKYP